MKQQIKYFIRAKNGAAMVRRNAPKTRVYCTQESTTDALTVRLWVTIRPKDRAPFVHEDSHFRASGTNRATMAKLAASRMLARAS